MDIQHLIDNLRASPEYAEQIVHIHEQPARVATLSPRPVHLKEPTTRMLDAEGIEQLYSHQAEAFAATARGEDLVITTGTASGKTLCYMIPALEALAANPNARCLLLFPTKALCQDQFQHASSMLDAAFPQRSQLAGVYDGDTPSGLRRSLRDHGRLLFSNPDMLHASIMAGHGRWADFLGNLKLIVLDEMHVYSGIFGTNACHLLWRLQRLCTHYGSAPQIVASSATSASPAHHFEVLTGRRPTVITKDGSPRGRRFYVFWNPPRTRNRTWRSRRSANVEAHELMAFLIQRSVPTICFSKAKITAEMIHRYVTEKLQATAPEYASKVTPYRGGYLPQERREIEKELFAGRLLGVSTTPALELGIDVGALDASIIVGYPGTQASFFQQAGRAGRKQRDSVAFLVGLDTSINQFIMANPEYIFGRAIEEAVLDPDNPFVTMNHLRCAAQELPLHQAELATRGPHAALAAHVLEAQKKLHHEGALWYHAAPELPQHEVSLRAADDANVLIQEAETNRVIGEMIREDAPPLLHHQAIYLHRGQTYRVLDLDMTRNLATVEAVDVDYYTQPLGGTDVHHIDQRLRARRLGHARVCWGEVTTYANTYAFQKFHFYTLDPISIHGLDLDPINKETLAFWIEPDEAVLAPIARDGLNIESGLRGIGYATRMLLPLFFTCDTLDYSHSIGSANSPWQATFVWERFEHGLGFTEKAFEHLHEILPRVLTHIQTCPCTLGCPCCVGKPLRQSTIHNAELAEGNIPSKPAAIAILQAFLPPPETVPEPDEEHLGSDPKVLELRLTRALRRRLDRGAEPRVMHPITPAPEVITQIPESHSEAALNQADATRRSTTRRSFDSRIRKRLARKQGMDGLTPRIGKIHAPPSMNTGPNSLTPRHVDPAPIPTPSPDAPQPKPMGDPLASRARRLRKRKGA
jgi:DEAD/DEAH box helicase domain-containing protein